MITPLKDFHARIARLHKQTADRIHNWRCGDRVIDIADPRHVGRVECIIYGEVKVRWEGTGYISIIDPRNLRGAR